MIPESDQPHIVVPHKTLLSITIMAAVVMQVLDTTIANVALPHMEASLGATRETITWVLTSYIVASAMAIPLTGWLASRLGVRRLFLLSVIVFVCASVMCGLAQTLPIMVAARLVQGVGGAFLGPLGQTIMLNINRPSEHGNAMSWYGMGVMVGPITGPVLGGWLTENMDWRWVFFVNVPIGIVCLAALSVLLPRVKEERRSFDMLGWALIAIALGAFQLLLDRGEHIDWFNSNEAWVEAGVAAGAAWMFVVHNFTTRMPLFPLAILKDRNLMVGCLIMATVALVQMSGMALLPTMLQTLFGYPVLTTGILLATRGVGVMFSMWLAGRILHLFDPRLMIAVGMLLMNLTVWWMTSWELDMDWHPILINGMIQGLGMGLIFVPLNVLSFGTLSPQNRTDGAGIFNLARNTGGSVGIAVVTVVLARNMQISHADLSAHVTPYNFPIDPTLLSGAGDTGEGVMRMVDGIVNRQAAMIAYIDDFYLLMVAGFIAMLMLVLVRKPQASLGEPLHLAIE